MAQVTKIGEFANQFEQDVIRYLGDHLPKTFEIIHNLELAAQNIVYEIDALILAPHCVFVVDVKGIKGEVVVRQGKWYPHRRMAFHSPVAKLRQHARTLNTLIASHNYAQSNLAKVHIEPVVILGTEVYIDDDRGTDELQITYADDRCLKHLQSPDRVPPGRLVDIQPYRNMVRLAIVGKAKPPNPLPCFHNWQTEKVLDRTEDYIDYLAHETLTPLKKMRLRAYGLDWLLSLEEQAHRRKLLSWAYQALATLEERDRRHILPIKTAFETPDEDFFVIVQEDLQATPIHQFAKQNPLDRDTLHRWVSALLTTLEIIHQRQVFHRNLTPDQILITPDGQLYLTGFDYARIGHSQTTIATDPEVLAALEAEARYHAPECYNDPSKASPQSDLFSLGVSLYEVLTGQCPFASAEEIFDRNAQFPQPASQLRPDLPVNLDSWLQSLCAMAPADRPSSADAALKTFAQLTAPPPTPLPSLTPSPILPPLDLRSLQPGDILDQRYTIVARLGEPGAFAVAYQVIEGWSEQQLVLKLVYRDPQSIYERLIQEYKALRQVSSHPHVVNCIFADSLEIQPQQEKVPYILFEYVAGESVDSWLEQPDLSLDQVLTLGRQVAEGLAHIHRRGVYHQDIKPDNLFWTENGVKIIDFNIAAFEDENLPLSAGTRRYMPPDLSRTMVLDNSDKIDRDLYALGITLYECFTQGGYPFETDAPLRGIKPKDPRQQEHCLAGLTDELVQWLLKVLEPRQADRFPDAATLLDALDRACTPSSPSEQQPQAQSQPQLQSKPQPQPETIATPPTASPQPSIAPLPPLSTPVTPAPARLAPVTSTPATPAPIALAPLTPPYPFAEGQCIVLDPTKRYPVPANCCCIASEVDWLQHCPDPQQFPAMRYWIQGKALGEWVQTWLDSWNRQDWIAEQKLDPAAVLPQYLGEIAPDPDWTPAQTVDLVNRLQRYPQNQALGSVLAELTQSLPDFWLSHPSREHLAQWLSLSVPEPWQALEQAWLAQQPASELDSYYRSPHKTELLRRWIGLDSPPLPDLGPYPCPIPAQLQPEFETYWYQTLAQVFQPQPTPDRPVQPQQLTLDLVLTQAPAAARSTIAQQAYQVLSHNPRWLTRDRLASLQPYLSRAHHHRLSHHLAPAAPPPLDPQATVDRALSWATEQYLPFRRWEVTHGIERHDRRSPALADSFIQWLLQAYPSLKEHPAAESSLNYHAAALVDELSNQGPVLWVVVDGLGWLDHQELLDHLTDSSRSLHALHLQRPLTPCLSILPTLTGYAKWSLFSQKLPSDPSWKEDAGAGFPEKTGYKRYTRSKIADLYKALRKQNYQVYCWDTVELDEAFHKYSDWQSWQTQERPRILRSLSEQILGLIAAYPEPNSLKLVISSDHGQILGTIPHLVHHAPELEHRGRLLIGEIDDDRFVVLEADRFGLPHALSIVRADEGLGHNAYANTVGESQGSHGGLFPEEVVIGYSVLQVAAAPAPHPLTQAQSGPIVPPSIVPQASVEALPLQVSISGLGQSNQPGQFTLTVHNPNPVPLEQPCLTIAELPAYQAGFSLPSPISAQTTTQITLDLNPWPTAIDPSQPYRLTGHLTGYLSHQNAPPSPLSPDSALIIQQIFVTKGPSLTDFF